MGERGKILSACAETSQTDSSLMMPETEENMLHKIISNFAMGKVKQKIRVFTAGFCIPQIMR